MIICDPWLPFGKAIKDYYEGNGDVKIEVYSDLGGKEFLSGRQLFREDGIEHLEEYALSLCKGKVLDLGAGSGSLSLLLQEDNLEVYPIDVASDAVEVMQKRGLLTSRCISFWDLDSKEKYDTLLLMMNGIGFTANLKGLNRFFEKASKHLNPGGQIILDSSDLSAQTESLDEHNEIEFGSANYRMKYKEYHGRPYKWFFCRFGLINSTAFKHECTAQLLYESEDHFLVRIIKK